MYLREIYGFEWAREVFFLASSQILVNISSYFEQEHKTLDTSLIGCQFKSSELGLKKYLAMEFDVGNVLLYSRKNTYLDIQ